MEAIIDSAIAFVEEVFRNDFSGHDAAHTIRVYRMAVKIAEAEHADKFTVALAALLHDVDDWKLSPETSGTKSRAMDFLERHPIPRSTIRAVYEILQEVSFRGRDSVVPATAEGKCVQDADRLDALGAIGIARTFAYGGSRRRPIFTPGEKPLTDMSEAEYKNRNSSSISHFYEKLLLLQEKMNTETGFRLASRRTAFMQSFLDEFHAEWDGRQ